MDRFDEGWEYDSEIDSELDRELAAGSPEVLYLSLIPDEERQRFWAERACGPTLRATNFEPDSLLFADRGAEAELCKEIRLSELWGGVRTGPSRWTNSSSSPCW